MTNTEIINDIFVDNPASGSFFITNTFSSNIILTERYKLGDTDAFPLDFDLPGKNSTGLSLLKFAGIWEGDDMDEVLELIKSTRSKTIF